MNSAEVLIKFKGDTSDADGAIKKQEKNLDGLKKTGELAFAGMTAAADAFAASILKTGISYNAQIETYLTRLETLTGSAEEANNVLNQIKKDALATPFEVSSLTQAESLLLATGLSAENARADILALGDAISASGGGNAELSRMAVNLQQIKNVGKATALDIKQFAYAGIDIYGLLADSMGVTREEATEMEITYDILSDALQNASKEGGKYYKAMEKQSKTYNGAMSNLKESAEVFAGTMSKDLFEALKGVIVPLTDLFDWLTNNKEIVMAIAVPLLTFLNIVAGFLIIKKITGLFAAFHAVLMANPIMLIVAAVAALIAGIVYLWNNCEAFRDFILTALDVIKAVFEAFVDFTWNVILQPIINFFTTAFTTIFDFISGIFTGIKDTFLSIVNFVWDKVLSPVVNFFKKAFNKIKDAVTTVFDGIKKTISKVFGTIGNIIKAPINGIISGINAVLKTLNKIKIPDWVPGLGGKGINFKLIPQLATGTNFVPEDMLAMIHKGEAVVPKKFNPYANGLKPSTIGSMQTSNLKPVFNVYVESNTDPLGQTVSHIKTFGNGAKNDYNYGVGV